MAQAYSNPERETDPHALPDIEVFYLDDFNEWWDDDAGQTYTAGWYWWPCFPGCTPDSDPIGPFKTEIGAIKDAQKLSD